MAVRVLGENYTPEDEEDMTVKVRGREGVADEDSEGEEKGKEKWVTAAMGGQRMLCTELSGSTTVVGRRRSAGLCMGCQQCKPTSACIQHRVYRHLKGAWAASKPTPACPLA